MRARCYTAWIRERLRRSPAVALIGPRQCGKTTLARGLPRTTYFDLESEADRLRLDVHWPLLLDAKTCVVLDEVQNMPELFPRLRSAIDADRRRCGRFLLLGSVSPALMKHVGESLAGRLAVCEMTPFLAEEFPEGRWDRLWRFGGYPDGGVLREAAFPAWAADYLTLLAQRDFPVWGLPALPPVTLRLFRMLAAVHGQAWNASQLGQSLGLSYHTVNGYLEFLEQAFLIRRLQPWHANVGKRLVKSPRVYWRDSGLLHALLGVTRETDLFSQPWVGASWEGWAIEQIVSSLHCRGIPAQPFWFRTSGRTECDLVLEFHGQRWAMEIKLTAHPKREDMRALREAAALLRADHAVLVSRTRENVWEKGTASVNIGHLLGRIAELNASDA